MKEKEITYDKCQICGYTGESSKFGKGEGQCPICGSKDIDDVSANPYEDDDMEDDEWGFI